MKWVFFDIDVQRFQVDDWSSPPPPLFLVPETGKRRNLENLRELALLHLFLKGPRSPPPWRLFEENERRLAPCQGLTRAVEWRSLVCSPLRTAGQMAAGWCFARPSHNRPGRGRSQWCLRPRPPREVPPLDEPRLKGRFWLFGWRARSLRGDRLLALSLRRWSPAGLLWYGADPLCLRADVNALCCWRLADTASAGLMSSLKNCSMPSGAALTCICRALSLIPETARSRRLNEISLKPLAKKRKEWPSGATASVWTMSTASNSLLRVSVGNVSAMSDIVAKGCPIVSRPLARALAVRPNNFCCFFIVLSFCHCWFVSGSSAGRSRGWKLHGPSAPPYTASIRNVFTTRTSDPPPDWVQSAVWWSVGESKWRPNLC